MFYKGYEMIEQFKITRFYSMFEKYFCGNYSFSGEYHNFWECVYVIDGNIRASGDERVYDLKPGNIIIHKPMELHKFYINNPNGAHLFIFSFSAEGTLCEALKNRVFLLSEEQNNIMLSLIRYAHEKNGGKENADENYNFLNLLTSLPLFPQTTASYLYLLFLKLSDNGYTSAASTDSEAIIFGNAVTFMNNHICQNPSVSEIAEYCCVSVTGLKRIFAKFAGIGIHKYFIQMKINTASSLLKSGKNVTETAEHLGFSDQGYFSKVYKRETGSYPSQIKGGENI